MQTLLLRVLLLTPCALFSWGLSAQTAGNNCGTAAANEYPVVDNTCTTTAMNSTNASNSFPAGSGCNAQNRDDAWAWFTATGNSTTVTYIPDTRDAILNVYSGACGALTQVGCSDALGAGGQESVTITTTAGNTYFIRIQRYNSNNNMTGDLCIVNNTASSGDDCTSPISVSCGDPALTGESTSTSPNTEANWSCGTFTYPGGDRFYVIQWPDAVNGGSVRVTLDNVSDANTTLMEVFYLGTTCSPNTCTDNRQFDISTGLYNGSNSNSFDFNVVAGIQNHYFVIDDQGDGIDSYDISFDCFTTGIQLDVNNSCGGTGSPCNYTIEMFDSYGDGWNGGFIDFYVNAVNSGPHAAAGFGSTATVGVATGNAVQLNYTSGGGTGGAPGYEAENTFILRDGRNAVLHSEIPNPTTGLLYSGTVSANNCGFDPTNNNDGIYQTWNGSLAPATADPVLMTGTYTVCENLYLENPAGFEWLKDVTVTLGPCWTNISNITPNGSNNGFYNADGDWAGSYNAGNHDITFSFSNSNNATWGDGHSGGFSCNLFQFCYDATVDQNCAQTDGFRNAMLAVDDGIGGSGGSTGTANVTLSQTSNTVNASTLPVSLIDFTATARDNGTLKYVDLEWVTASEENNDYFTIERSADGVNFSHWRDVDAIGNGNEVSRYMLVDQHPLPGVSYYRLYQTDHNGSAVELRTAAVAFKYDEIVTVGPVPASDVVQINIFAGQPSNVKYELMDVSGKLIVSDNFEVEAGGNLVPVEVAAYPSGVYFIRIQIGENVYRERLMIRH